MEKGEKPGQVLLSRQEFGDCLNIVQEAIDDEVNENVREFLEEIGLDIDAGEQIPTRDGLLVIDRVGVTALIGSMSFDQTEAEEEIKIAISKRDFERSKAIREAVRVQKSLLRELVKLSPDAIVGEDKKR